MTQTQKMSRRKTAAVIAGAGVAALLIALLLILAIHKMTRVHYAADFGFEDVKSTSDADGDGVDDYTDIKNGALDYIATAPVYGSKYYSGGYPDDGMGVCTEVIWNAFRAAGYDLKAMVDRDIAENPDAYPDIEKPDPNIDFRRVRNLRIFFERHAEVLTTEFRDPADWQPGDIVVFDPSHIGICSDKRNFRGVPYLIHHGNIEDGAVEADDMRWLKVAGHYRWTPAS
mgnify:CR=1 FL=1